MGFKVGGRGTPLLSSWFRSSLEGSFVALYTSMMRDLRFSRVFPEPESTPSLLPENGTCDDAVN